MPAAATLTMRDNTHNNTDRSNAFCHCAIGVNHGNLPLPIRAAVIDHLLTGHAGRYTLEDVHDDLMVRIPNVSDTPAIYRALTRLRPQRRNSWDREGSGLLIPAAVFNG